MSLTVSPPVRIAAFLGLAAALALGGAFMLLGRKHEAVAAPRVIRHHPFGAGAKQAAAKKAAPAHVKLRHAAKAAPAKPVTPVHRAPEKPSAEVVALRAGLPAAVARALGQHSVVVVELTDPQAEVDGIAFAEAKAGAELAGAGFVPLNVLSQADVGKLTVQFGQILPDPGLLVYTRPATLTVRIDGFVDKESVAQAAQNAAHGQ